MVSADTPHPVSELSLDEELELAIAEAWQAGFVTGNLSRLLTKVTGRLIEAEATGNPPKNQERLQARLEEGKSVLRHLPKLPGVQRPYGHKTTQRRGKRSRKVRERLF